jgi:DNA-binding NarL/FixJ family response regulator
MKTSSKTPEQYIPTIVIADDHELYRKGLTLFVENEGMKIVEIAATGRQAVLAAVKHQPDILILDIAMPDLDGLLALSIVKFLLPETRVVILTALPDSQYLSRASDLGADGYFSKGVDNDQLVAFLRKIAPSGSSLEDSKSSQGQSKSIERTSFFTRYSRGSSKGKRLTDDEKSILKLISRGNDYEKVAEQMAVTRDTLNVHLSKIFSKLAVSNRSHEQLYGMFNKF